MHQAVEGADDAIEIGIGGTNWRGRGAGRGSYFGISVLSGFS
jgi:hypothetical protein